MRRSPFLLSLLVLAPALLSGCLGGEANDWALDLTGLDALHGRGLSGKGIRVAIIDTGINAKHPSLDHVRIAAWRDYVQNQAQPYDDVGHGSHVAGIVVAKGGSAGARFQGFDLQGAAPAAELVVVKAIGADGTGDSSDVADGIEFAINNRSDVICLSLGSRASPLNIVGDDISNAISAAVAQGILVVAAAGNTGEDGSRSDVESPGTIEGVVAVGAVDREKRVASFSAYGNDQQNHGLVAGNELTAPRKDPHKKPEIVAPGVDIKSAWTGKDYAVAKGTSQATPFVCGALALALEAKPQLRDTNTSQATTKVKNALMESAEKLAGYRQPHDNQAGYGLLRADRLVDRL